MDHGLECFARLVALLLGRDAVAEDKLECGTSLVILGILIELSERGYKCRPSKEKVALGCACMLLWWRWRRGR